MSSGQKLLDALQVQLQTGQLSFSEFFVATKEVAASGRAKSAGILADALARLDTDTAIFACVSTLGLPLAFKHRLIFAPRGIPAKKRIGFASSRLSHRLEEFPCWFDFLRTVCARLDPQTEAIVCTDQTAGTEFVRRCAYLFGCDRIEISVASEKQKPADWLLRLSEQDFGDTGEGKFPLFISPELQLDTQTETNVTVQRDMIHCQFCEVIYALHVAKNGNIFRALLNRMNQSDHRVSVFVSVEADRMQDQVREKLVQQGAHLHYLLDRAEDECLAVPAITSTRITSTTQSILDFDPSDFQEWIYLSHCTRRRTGPWPDEQAASFIDDLIFQRSGADHSAIAALCRILRTGKIIATSDYVRGDAAVVSFSEKPLYELLKQRIFRSHLARWDFEPYGICIKRDVLLERGTRKVTYLADDDWSSFSKAELPFLQKYKLGDQAAQPGIDWRVEEEWRMIGDVSLRKLSQKDAFVFVPSIEDAKMIGPFTNLPIVLTHPSDKQARS